MTRHLHLLPVRQATSRQIPLLKPISRTHFHSNNKRMATVNNSIPHTVRTANDTRQRTLYNATIGRIEQVNDKIRLFRLYLDPDGPPLRFLPGQYVDLHVPDCERVGGFTISSPPQFAVRQPGTTPSNSNKPHRTMFDDPHVELAVQKAPENPPAAYLWRAQEEIMNAPVTFRIGGNFTLPPMSFSRNEFEGVDNVVLVAGGVGINPIMSMVSAMDLSGARTLGGMPQRLRVLYSSKRGQSGAVLFGHRLTAVARKWARRGKEDGVDFHYTLFETSLNVGQSDDSDDSVITMSRMNRRMTLDDLETALGPEDKRANTLVYVCGLPSMTDELVEALSKTPGLDQKRIMFEKWW